MREEVKWFAKICSSASRLEHCWDELWGGGNQRRNKTLVSRFPLEQ